MIKPVNEVKNSSRHFVKNLPNCIVTKDIMKTANFIEKSKLELKKKHSLTHYSSRGSVEGLLCHFCNFWFIVMYMNVYQYMHKISSSCVIQKF